MKKTLVDGFIRRIRSRIQNFNQISVEKRGLISPTCIFRGVTISGQVEIGEGTRIIGGVHIAGKVRIGCYASINGPNTDLLSKINWIKVGNFSSIARNVSIQEYNHHSERPTTFFMQKNVFGEPLETDISSRGDIVIGNDVWIGTKVTILSGITIGDGAIVAANSVVTNNIPPFAIVGGCPARIIKYRFDEPLIARLNELGWWNWPVEKVKKNQDFFRSELTLESFSKIR